MTLLRFVFRDRYGIADLLIWFFAVDLARQGHNLESFLLFVGGVVLGKIIAGACKARSEGSDA
ncbi:hypothetical protein [Neorhizobium petrolearium]|uniref:Uncharacterized protein n=1 Tax=Neorhizobium petrolearium TaxID=515361 RepID=A0ABY8M2Q0_9HYPH|nr:hypothetical protein [Neorhizobium petrolearium]MCC2608369.1 hypothetical protein [Neorhizobium petrolearium]WGI68648.1 hypothetical protein QEO92_00675 [Neorhizobium petrolearium]